MFLGGKERGKNISGCSLGLSSYGAGGLQGIHHIVLRIGFKVGLNGDIHLQAFQGGYSVF